jgi:hypothetical protein
MKQQIHLQFAVLCLFVAGAVLLRLLIDVPNVSPVAALALFGAAHFSRKWQAFVIPIAAIWLSDLIINNVVYAQWNEGFIWFYSGFYWQYLSYLLIGLLGMGLLRKKITLLRTAGGALGSGLIFFTVSNFGVWLSSAMYSPDLSGLIACYTAAIPFYRGTVTGDLIFTAVFFGGFYLLQWYQPQLKPSHVNYHAA